MNKLPNLLLLPLLFSIIVAPVMAMPWDTPKTQIWYVSSTTHTVNTVLGYFIGENRSDTPTYLTDGRVGTFVVQWGWRLWTVDKQGTKAELTSGSPNATYTVNGNSTGIHESTWTAPQTTLSYAAYAVEFGFYHNLSATWYRWATFVSSLLDTKLIVASTWSFKVYVEVSQSGGNTQLTLRWGSQAYNTRIENVQLGQLSPWDAQDSALKRGDWVGFFLSPWTYFISNLFYLIAVMFIFVTVYLRYDSFKPCIVLAWLFGGTGGILTLLIPALGLHVSWFLLAFALAATLFTLFQ